MISPDLLTTILLLVLAHLIADYPLQTNKMVENKAKPNVMLAHISIVFALSLLALKGQIGPALAIAVAHLLIDIIKVDLFPKGPLWPYLVDQLLHFATIALVAVYWPNISSFGWGALWPDLHYGAVILSGLIISTWFAGPIIGKLMEPFVDAKGDGLDRAGSLIGLFERGLTFALVISGNLTAIGFLIAAKSILRFETDQKKTEYVIIGTLASFAWALGASFATLTVIRLLGIDIATP